MKTEKGVTVTMRDGVKISLCVYRPDAPGKYPTLFAASPYQYEMDEVPAYPLFLWRETGPVEWYIEQGYAYVHADVRGAGQSEGEFSFMGLNEQQDYLEILAWIIKQPWCNGRVGGIGQSYYAMAQWLMATYNPPGLACIAPYDGLVDQYRGSNYHGGIYCSYRSVWYTTLRADNQHRPAGKHGRPPMRFDMVGEIINHTLDDDFWQRALAVLAARQDQVSGAVDRPLGQDGTAPARQHHRLRGGQGAEEARRHRRAQYVRSAQDVRPGGIPRKGIAAVLRPASQGQEQRLHGGRAGAGVRARRQCLARGGAMAAEARVYVPYYLRKGPSGSVTSMNDGGLSAEKPPADEQATSYTYPDWEWVNGVAIIGPDGRVDPVKRVLTFTSAPLDSDLDVTGPIVLKLFASSTAIDTQFIVKLTDQHPQDEAARKAGTQPAFTPVSKGWLKASHREKDEKRSKPDAAVLHPHQSAADRARQGLRIRHRGAADLLRVQEGPPHPARARQQRFARDRRRVLASLSSDADGHRHHPPRRSARLVHHAAGKAMSGYAGFKQLEIDGWTNAARAKGYVDLFAQASDQAIGPLLAAAGAKAGLSALDLCCGQGNVTQALAKHGCKVTGADFSPAMLAMARTRVPGASFIEADAQDLPFGDKSFDIVVSNLGICHVPDQPLALKQAKRVLRAGGRFAMTVWCGPPDGPAYEMLYNAIKTLGAPGIAPPPGPDFHLFAAHATAECLLSEAGFSGIEHAVVDCAWQYDQPEGFVEMFERGTVRAAMVLGSQPPQNREAIRKALTGEVRTRFAHDGRWRVPAPAALISATA